MGHWKVNKKSVDFLKYQQFADSVPQLRDDKTLTYFQPVRFVEQMKLIVPRVTEWNPYEDKIINKGTEKLTVKDSPGFAPLHDNRKDSIYYEYGEQKYARVSGLYDEDYTHLGRYKERYQAFYHEGVDFGADEGTKIISFIHGHVVAVGEMGGNSSGYGNIILVKDIIKTDLLYLLAHLSKQLVKEGMDIYPGMEVGEVGKTGGNYFSHLHIGLLKTKLSRKIDILNYSENSHLYTWKGSSGLPNYYNPFDHNDDKKRKNISK